MQLGVKHEFVCIEGNADGICTHIKYISIFDVDCPDTVHRCWSDFRVREGVTHVVHSHFAAGAVTHVHTCPHPYREASKFYLNCSYIQ